MRNSSNHKDYISTTGTFRDSFYVYDNDSNKHIEWDPDDRVLKVMNGRKTTVSVSTFMPDSGKTTQTVAGGYTVNGKTYELLRGVADVPGTGSETEDLEVIFYYSDGYFMGNTKEYNYHLATMSMNLANAAGYSRVEGSGSDQLIYLDKTNNFRQLMSDIGVKDEDIYINENNVRKPGTFTIGVSIAKKELPDDNTLVVIGVRGIGYEAEWVSNMTLGTEGEAKGFSTAATQVFAELRQYLDKKGIDGSSEKTKFWITGFSRAGATANLTAKRIVDTYDNKGTHTFAYPMEPPKGGIESEKVAGNDYSCIHNTINNNDLVPWVGPGEMGFIRYGADHYIPGSITSDASNHAWAVKSDEYKKQRALMKVQLKTIDSEMPFDDYFHSATVDYIGNMVFSQLGWERIGETIRDKWTAEEYIPLFFKKTQEYSLDYSDSYRKSYAGVKIKNDRSFEQAGGMLAGLLFSKSPEDMKGLAGCFADLTNRLSTSDMIKLYEGIRQYNSNILSYVSPLVSAEETVHEMMGSDNWEGLRKTIWTKLTTLSDEDRACGYHAISEYLTDDELKELQACFDSLMVPIIELVTRDYDKYDQDLVGTLAYNAGTLLMNHYPEVVTAWLRSYDTFYTNDTSPVTMQSTVRTAPSDVAAVVTSEDGTQRTYTSSDTTIMIFPADKISFVPSDATDKDKGEGIYYAISSASDRVWHAYTNPVSLDSSYETDGKITIKTLAAHYDQRTEEKTFTFDFYGKAKYYSPSLTELKDVSYSEKVVEYCGSYDLNVNFKDNADAAYIFKNWNVYYCSEKGTKGEMLTPNKYYEYLGEGFDPCSETCTIVNKTGQNFRFEPVYSTLISELEVVFHAARDDNMPAVIYDITNKNSEIPVAWYFDSEQNKYIAQFTETLKENVSLADKDNLHIDWGLEITNQNRDQNGWEKFEITNPVVQNVTVSGKNVTVEAAFDFTSGYGDGKLLDTERVTLIAMDENTNQEIERYYFFSGTATSRWLYVCNPTIKDMQFTRWSEGITVQGTRRCLEGSSCTVYYRPVVNAVKVTFDKSITPAQEMPVLDSATATITNEWRIDNAELEWINGGRTAGFETVYTAHIHVDTKNLYGTNLSIQDSASVPLSGAFTFADKVTVDVKAKDGSEPQVLSSYFTNGDDGQVYLDITFAATPKERIVSVNDVQITAPYGSTGDYIAAALLAEVTAITETGAAVQVNAVWTSVGAPDPSMLRMQTVGAVGTISSDKYDVSGIAQISAVVTVTEAPAAVSPTALRKPGTYEGKQEIVLIAEEGADIYYCNVNFDAGMYTEKISTETAVLDENGHPVFNDDSTPAVKTAETYRDTYYPENISDLAFTKMDSHITIDQINKDNYIIISCSIR